MKQVKLTVSGKVQGVFFRHYTRQQALKLGLRGYVKNLVNGDVEIVAQGDPPQVDRLIEWAKSGSPAAEVNNLKLEVMFNEDEFQDFAIRY
ncbi:MAG: acylphosphatase [Xenococcaceae cyanobacterium]